MSKKENVMTILQGMGYSPTYDEDGDISIIFQMKQVFFFTNEDEEEENYLSILLPKFIDVNEGEESLALAVCNKMTRELKMVKVYVDNSFNSVSGACEMFYVDDEALKYSIKKSLRMIGMVRSLYYKTLKDLS